MTYELIGISGNGDRRSLGTFPQYADAVRARGDDVFAQLRHQGGWWTRAEHVIVGPGLDGPHTEHGFCTEFGVDRDRGEAPTIDDLIDAREWLTALHQPLAP